MTRACCLFLITTGLCFLFCSVADLAAQNVTAPANETAQEPPADKVDTASGLRHIEKFFSSLGIGKPPPEPKQPEWFPLEPKKQDWVDQVLAYWEKRSNEVKTLECDFQTWQYDPPASSAAADRRKTEDQLKQLPASQYSSGVIKYAAPDKWLFHVTRLQVLIPSKPTEEPRYESSTDRGHWLTDGQRIIAFDGRRKQVYDWLLPTELQGRALADGPLSLGVWGFAFGPPPFLLGAKAEALKADYWIRPLQSEKGGEYCLELIPKSRRQWANFQSAQLVLDDKTFQPIRLQLFESNWYSNQSRRTIYAFDKQVVNNAKLDHRVFSEVKIPVGWRRNTYDSKGNLVRHNWTAELQAVPER